MTEINGAEIEAVDVITFGSPCQDLSVAGKRAGLKHSANGDDETTRSGLFLEAVRIIKEMRRATHGEYPKVICWENVPGAFSSNKGEDFRTVLEELVKIVEPEAPPIPSPGKAGWPYADCIVGDGWSLAWRVFDAQYWPGTPQRRRRIYLVLDLTGERAEKVLFEHQGLRGHSEEIGTPWEGTPGHAEDRSGADDPKSGIIAVATQQGGAEISENGICPTITAAAGVSGNNQPWAVYGISSYDSNAMKSSNPHAGIYEATTSRTLDLNGGNPACNQGGIAIVEPVAFTQNQRDEVRDLGDKAGAIQAEPGMKQQTFIIDNIGGQAEYGKESQVNGTLRAGAQGAIAYCYDARGNGDGQTTNTITGDHNNRITDYSTVVTYATDVGFFNTCEDVSPTMLARMYKDPHLICYEQEPEYIVRRLTPTECARLQGFPDRWGDIPLKDTLTDEEYSFWLSVRNTHAAINGRATKEYTKDQILKWYNKLHSDSAEYKMWGNGIALPCALYVMQGIAEAVNK